MITCAWCGQILTEENPKEHKCKETLDKQFFEAILRVTGLDKEEDYGA